MFFTLSSWAVALVVFAIVAGVTIAGYTTGSYLREHHESLREPFGVLQGALLGVVALILAFGLTLAVGRYEDRRAATVSEANAIGTTYLRAQLVAEPARSRSLELLRSYTDLAIRISKEVPGSPGMRRTDGRRGHAPAPPLGRSPGRRSPPRPSPARRASTSTASTQRSTRSRPASRR